MGIIKLRLTDGSNTYTMTRLEVIRRIQAGTEVYTIGPDGTRARVRALQPDAQSPAGVSLDRAGCHADEQPAELAEVLRLGTTTRPDLTWVAFGVR
jgi:hypothetical protein